MTAADLITLARNDGLTLSMAPDGTLVVRGPAEARAHHLPEIRAHKADLVTLLTEPHRLWTITEPDGTQWTSSFCPPQTLEQVRERYPGALSVGPCPSATTRLRTPLSSSQSALVTSALDHLGEDDAQIRMEVLDLARRPDIAQGYRDRAQRTKRMGGRP
jgi:hypothetical protein